MLKKQLLGFLLGTLGLLAGQASAAILSFSPDNPNVIESQAFEVDVVLDPEGVLVGGFSFNVDFDPLVLAITDVQFSNSLGDPFIEALPDFDDSVAGTVDIFNVSLLFDSELIPLQPAAGFTIATLSFLSIADGMSPLGFSSIIVSDDLGLGTSSSGIAGSVDVSPIPLPGALWLMLTGLLGIRTLVRKRGGAA